MHGSLDAIIGGWATAGVFRLTQRLPVHRHQLPPVLGDELGPSGQRGAGRSRRAAADGHDEGRDRRLSEPVQGSAGRRSTTSGARYPGEVGQRNVLRGDGYFSIDLSLSKTWSMPWAKNQKLRFRWDTFNLTNTPKFDVQFLDVYPGPRGHVRPLLQHHRDLRRRRRPLHAVCAPVRILEGRRGSRHQGFSFGADRRSRAARSLKSPTVSSRAKRRLRSAAPCLPR